MVSVKYAVEERERAERHARLIAARQIGAQLARQGAAAYVQRKSMQAVAVTGALQEYYHEEQKAVVTALKDKSQAALTGGSHGQGFRDAVVEEQRLHQEALREAIAWRAEHVLERERARLGQAFQDVETAEVQEVLRGRHQLHTLRPQQVKGRAEKHRQERARTQAVALAAAEKEAAEAAAGPLAPRRLFSFLQPPTTSTSSSRPTASPPRGGACSRDHPSVQTILYSTARGGLGWEVEGTGKGNTKKTTETDPMEVLPRRGKTSSPESERADHDDNRDTESTRETHMSSSVRYPTPERTVKRRGARVVVFQDLVQDLRAVQPPLAPTAAETVPHAASDAFSMQGHDTMRATRPAGDSSSPRGILRPSTVPSPLPQREGLTGFEDATPDAASNTEEWDGAHRWAARQRAIPVAQHRAAVRATRGLRQERQRVQRCREASLREDEVRRELHGRECRLHHDRREGGAVDGEGEGEEDGDPIARRLPAARSGRTDSHATKLCRARQTVEAAEHAFEDWFFSASGADVAPDVTALSAAVAGGGGRASSRTSPNPHRPSSGGRNLLRPSQSSSRGGGRFSEDSLRRSPEEKDNAKAVGPRVGEADVPVAASTHSRRESYGAGVLVEVPVQQLLLPTTPEALLQQEDIGSNPLEGRNPPHASSSSTPSPSTACSVYPFRNAGREEKHEAEGGGGVALVLAAQGISANIAPQRGNKEALADGGTVMAVKDGKASEADTVMSRRSAETLPPAWSVAGAVPMHREDVQSNSNGKAAVAVGMQRDAPSPFQQPQQGVVRPSPSPPSVEWGHARTDPPLFFDHTTTAPAAGGGGSTEVHGTTRSSGHSSSSGGGGSSRGSAFRTIPIVLGDTPVSSIPVSTTTTTLAPGAAAPTFCQEAPKASPAPEAPEASLGQTDGSRTLPAEPVPDAEETRPAESPACSQPPLMMTVEEVPNVSTIEMKTNPTAESADTLVTRDSPPLPSAQANITGTTPAASAAANNSHHNHHKATTTTTTLLLPSSKGDTTISSLTTTTGTSATSETRSNSSQSSSSLAATRRPHLYGWSSNSRGLPPPVRWGVPSLLPTSPQASRSTAAAALSSLMKRHRSPVAWRAAPPPPSSSLQTSYREGSGGDTTLTSTTHTTETSPVAPSQQECHMTNNSTTRSSSYRTRASCSSPSLHPSSYADPTLRLPVRTTMPEEGPRSSNGTASTTMTSAGVNTAQPPSLSPPDAGDGVERLRTRESALSQTNLATTMKAAVTRGTTGMVGGEKPSDPAGRSPLPRHTQNVMPREEDSTSPSCSSSDATTSTGSSYTESASITTSRSDGSDEAIAVRITTSSPSSGPASSSSVAAASRARYPIMSAAQLRQAVLRLRHRMERLKDTPVAAEGGGPRDAP